MKISFFILLCLVAYVACSSGQGYDEGESGGRVKREVIFNPPFGVFNPGKREAFRDHSRVERDYDEAQANNRHDPSGGRVKREFIPPFGVDNPGKRESFRDHSRVERDYDEARANQKHGGV